MKHLIIALTLLVMSAPVLAGNPNSKILVCRVGSEPGSEGETYLENPDCTIPEGWQGEYQCPDAARIDLILVSTKANHIGNSTHA